MAKLEDLKYRLQVSHTQGANTRLMIESAVQDHEISFSDGQTLLAYVNGLNPGSFNSYWSPEARAGRRQAGVVAV